MDKKEIIKFTKRTIAMIATHTNCREGKRFGRSEIPVDVIITKLGITEVDFYMHILPVLKKRFANFLVMITF